MIYRPVADALENVNIDPSVKSSGVSEKLYNFSSLNFDSLGCYT